MKQTKKYPAPQISEAVFRGRNSLYNFEVYPMNVRFNEVPAVYIISKRKIDRNGKGHHFLVCIGQTESLVEDIKKHRRGKCVKQLQADTVSVILEDDQQKRLEVENDIKAAHTIPCRRETADADFVFNPIEKIAPQFAKPEAKKSLRELKNEISVKSVMKKPFKNQVETEEKTEVSKLKRTKSISVPVESNVKADKNNLALKKQKAEKKLETTQAKKTVQSDQSEKKTVGTNSKTKTEKAKIQKIEVSKPKKAIANIGKAKIDKKTVNPKIDASKLKKDVQIKVRTKAKKTPVKSKSVSVPTPKKPSVNDIKPKTKVKVEAAKSKGNAQKNGEVKAGKTKAIKTKTVETLPKPVKKNPFSVKSSKSAKVLKTPEIKKAQPKIKVSDKTKTVSKISATKSGAQARTPKREKVKQIEAPEFVKAKKMVQSKTIAPAKTKGKAEVPKLKQSKKNAQTIDAAPELKSANRAKVKANKKAEIGIKSSVKGKENRLKSSSRKRLAF